jgi:hypothetical protein
MKHNFFSRFYLNPSDGLAKSSRPFLALATALAALTGLFVSSCAVVPEPVAPKIATTSTSNVQDGLATISGEVATNRLPAGSGSACTDWYQLPNTIEPGLTSGLVYITTTGYCGPVILPSRGIPSYAVGNDEGTGSPRNGSTVRGPEGLNYTFYSGAAEFGPSDVGDKAVSMSYKFDDGSNIIIKIEYTAATHKVEKISTTTTGLIYGTVFKPFGDGLASYDSATNTYRFMVEFQFEGGTVQTGPIQAGPIYRIEGIWNEATTRYSMKMRKL